MSGKAGFLTEIGLTAAMTAAAVEFAALLAFLCELAELLALDPRRCRQTSLILAGHIHMIQMTSYRSVSRNNQKDFLATLSGDLFISEHIRRLSLCLGNMTDDFKPQNATRLKQVAEKLENYGDMVAANKIKELCNRRQRCTFSQMAHLRLPADLSLR